MTAIGNSNDLRSLATEFARTATLMAGLAGPPSGDGWWGPAAGGYRRIARAVADRTKAVAGELAPVPGLLMRLADSLESAGVVATQWAAKIDAAQGRRAQAEATGDPTSIAASEDELGEVKSAADRAVERSVELVSDLDRRVAATLDGLLEARNAVEVGLLAERVETLMAGDVFRRELELMVAATRLDMAEHARGRLTDEIEHLELTLAYLQMLGLNGVDLRLVDEFRRHRTRLLEWAASERQFLAYDPSAGSRVVEVFGDLAHAEHVAVLVPGMTNSEFNYHASLAVAARSLQDGDPSVAVIAWLGYDTPGAGPTGTGMLTFGAVGTDLAAAGAEELAQFVAWLAARRQDAHLTVIAHSYGSVVAGLAAADGGLAIDDLVLIGSPGVPVDNRADLQLRPGGTVWAGLAPWDPIDELADLAAPGAPLIHGSNPAAGAFGAEELRFDDSFGHGGYFDASGIPVLMGVILGRASPRVREPALADAPW